MIAYLTRTVLCMAVFLLVYLLFLEKDKMHRFNRWYLLGSIFCSFIIPLIIIRVPSPSIPLPTENYFTNTPEFSGQVSQPSINTAPVIQQTNYLIPALIILYAVITGLLLCRLLWNMYKLVTQVSTNETHDYKGARLVLLPCKTVSHTFLNNIFISAEDYRGKTIEEEILIHELAHAKQKHSCDVIFIEFVQAIFWFNPLLLLYKKAIQLNHEFLADDAVIRSSNNVTGYQELLFTKAMMGNRYPMASAFNYSVTKKRLVMMTRTTNRAIAVLKQVGVLPLLAGAIFLFAAKSIVAQDSPASAIEANDIDTKANPAFPLALIRNTPFTKEGVTEEIFANYKAAEKKYMRPGKRYQEVFDFNAIGNTERSYLESVFKKMSREQQSRCQLIFTPPLGTIKADPPTNEQLNRWRNEKVYRVLIGDEIVSPEELEKYSASDFASAIVDTKKSADKQHEDKYTYQVSLLTWKSHNEMNARLKAEKNFSMGFFGSPQAPTDADTTIVKKAHLFTSLGDLPPNPAGASKEMIDEYNSIVNRTIVKAEKNRMVFKGNDEDRKKLFDVYKQMNAAQQHDAKVGFSKKMEPIKKAIPTAAQLAKWKNPADYGVWIDGKKVNNEQLNKYNPSDFSHYDASNLAYNDKAKKDIMERYNLKTMYKVQLNLMTNSDYEKHYAASMAAPEFNMFYHISYDPEKNREVEWRFMLSSN